MSTMHITEFFERWLDAPGRSFTWQSCDTPIEDDIFRQLYYFADDQLTLRRQHKVDTDAGTFRLDFLLSHRTTGRAIGIECDGRDFHSVSRDRERDEAIIRSGAVAEIYRVRGKDCHYCGRDVVQLLAQLEPWVFADEFRQDFAIFPAPGTYIDERLSLTDGYRGIMRTYLDQVEGEYEDSPCFCEGECDCIREPVMVESSTRTPTIVRYMSGQGFPSAYEIPTFLNPLPVPEWKRQLREHWYEATNEHHHAIKG